RELGQRDRGVGVRALDLVAIGVALRRALQIEQAPVPARDLHPLIAEIRRPFRDARERVERRPIARELGEKDRRPLDRLHLRLPLDALARTLGDSAPRRNRIRERTSPKNRLREGTWRSEETGSEQARKSAGGAPAATLAGIPALRPLTKT